MELFESARVAKLVRHEEKLENLERFIGCYLDRLSVIAAPAPADRMVTLLARSPNSPAAQALIALSSELRSLDVTLGVIFTKLEPAEPLSSWIDLAQPQSHRRAIVCLRWARNPSLLDAHEQMVLGPLMSWSGDCMRRIPESRDAYELYDTCHEQSARRAALSFKAMWEVCEGLPFSRPLAMPAGLASPGEPGIGAFTGELPQSVTVSTRH